MSTKEVVKKALTEAEKKVLLEKRFQKRAALLPGNTFFSKWAIQLQYETLNAKGLSYLRYLNPFTFPMWVLNMKDDTSTARTLKGFLPFWSVLLYIVLGLFATKLLPDTDRTKKRKVKRVASVEEDEL